MEKPKWAKAQQKPARRLPKPIATSEQTLEKVQPLLAIIYTLLEAGVAEAHQWFQQRKKPVNRVAFAMLVRLKIFEDLEAKTQAAGLKCRVMLLANVGVRVKFNGSTIAIWKADKDGQLPPCGESDRRQDFYRQDTLPDMYGSDAVPPKLALLWEANGPLAVKLVAPRGFNSLWTAGQIHWEIDVPHPAKAVTLKTDLTSDAEELDDILTHKKTADEPNQS